MVLPSKHLLTSVKFTFCTDNLPRVSLGFFCFVFFFLICSLQTDLHVHCAHSCTPLAQSDSALLPGFFHSVDWSWLGPHFGCKKLNPQEGIGHEGRRSCSKETPDAVSAASLLEEAQVRGVARTHPSPSCWNMPAGSLCGPWGKHGHCHCPRGGPWRALHVRIQL